MKILRLALLAACLARLFSTAALAAEENRYDLLGRLLRPFAALLAKGNASPNRGLLLSARLELLTDMPPALEGARADLAFQYPDKLRLHMPLLGEDVTVCRDGQELWAFPGAKIEALLNAGKLGKKLSPSDAKAPIEPFGLPIPQKELALLPALFQVKDVGSETLDGAACRVLDLYLMPELARSMKAQNWAARVWVRGDGTPARLSLAKPGWQIAVRFERVAFSPKLPSQTWQPSPEQAGDVLKLDPARYRQLLGGFVK